MPVPLVFGTTVAFGLIAWSVYASLYLWPTLKSRPFPDALRPILVLHAFRYIGLIELIPGVVSPVMTTTLFSRGLAYGDLTTAILALIALAAIRSRWFVPLVWIFNLAGTADLLNAFYQGNRILLANDPGRLGAAYFLPMLGVPLLLVTHFLVFRLLLGRRVAAR
jgi:hypothetical protein